MKAIVFKNKINVVPMPMKDGLTLYARLNYEPNEFTEPLVTTRINKGQKVYELPCKRSSLRALYIK